MTRSDVGTTVRLPSLGVAGNAPSGGAFKAPSFGRGFFTSSNIISKNLSKELSEALSSSRNNFITEETASSIISFKKNFKSEINDLESKLQEKVLNIASYVGEDKDKKIEELERDIEEINRKKEIQHFLSSVSSKAHRYLIEDTEFISKFQPDDEVNAFVVSVDIRRSTELMLKARTPKLFSDFITTLFEDLEGIFKENWAVVDKFTGDGILAFFPEFYSGEDAGYFALKSATEANEAFEKRYRQFRTYFSTVLRDVGLGTGIDYGSVHLVSMAGALTIVGQPVVYACRMGGAPAGKIFLNQPAFETISQKYENHCSALETSIEIKSEGALICYDVNLNDKSYSPKSPDWLSASKG